MSELLLVFGGICLLCAVALALGAGDGRHIADDEDPFEATELQRDRR
jgi:hypothetical protein